MRPSTLLTGLSILGVVGVGLAYPAFAQDQRKDATAATKAANDRLLDELPFSDRSDFENARRGLIAPLPAEMIQGQAGNLIWNPQQYSFITEDAAAPDTVNPSPVAADQHQRPLRGHRRHLPGPQPRPVEHDHH
jgi:alkyl sulfatase BDS1-like metallo-beta-lactamase superfamily hydrolase